MRLENPPTMTVVVIALRPVCAIKLASMILMIWGLPMERVGPVACVVRKNRGKEKSQIPPRRVLPPSRVVSFGFCSFRQHEHKACRHE